jgi:hypothetical protein
VTTVTQNRVYIQRDWTDKELRADGFLCYRPVKRVTMVRKLPLNEAPMTMKASGHSITAEAAPADGQATEGDRRDRRGIVKAR